MHGRATLRASLGALVVALVVAAALLGAVVREIDALAPDRSPAALVKAAEAWPASTARDAADGSATGAAGDQHAGGEGGLGDTRQFDEPYDAAMVVERRTWTWNGRDTIDVAVLNETEDADLAETAKACVAAVLPGHDYAQCYVFDSRRELDFKNLSAQVDQDDADAAARAGGTTAGTREAYGLTILCWTTLGRGERGGDVTVADMRDAPQTWTSQGCPGW